MAIFLSLGTNLGDRLQNLAHAIARLQEYSIHIKKISNIYETQPWGFATDSWFLNLVIEIQTALSPYDLLVTTQKIERKLGRREKTQNALYQSRIIDIDLLIYHQHIIATPQLTVPHKHLHQRKFVLVPLNDIAPDYIHPTLQVPFKKLLKTCPDRSEVKLYATNESLKSLNAV